MFGEPEIFPGAWSNSATSSDIGTKAAMVDQAP
jgi:hypothetical protein